MGTLDNWYAVGSLSNPDNAPIPLRELTGASEIDNLRWKDWGKALFYKHSGSVALWCTEGRGVSLCGAILHSYTQKFLDAYSTLAGMPWDTGSPGEGLGNTVVADLDPERLFSDLCEALHHPFGGCKEDDLQDLLVFILDPELLNTMPAHMVSEPEYSHKRTIATVRLKLGI